MLIVVAALTRAFLEEWAKKFGSVTYVLVDSFNELDLPPTDRPITEVLADECPVVFDEAQHWPELFRSSRH